MTGPAAVEGDPVLIGAALVSNLLNNAVRHNVVGGRVEVATGGEGSHGGALGDQHRTRHSRHRHRSPLPALPTPRPAARTPRQRPRPRPVHSPGDRDRARRDDHRPTLGRRRGSDRSGVPGRRGRDRRTRVSTGVRSPLRREDKPHRLPGTACPLLGPGGPAWIRGGLDAGRSSTRLAAAHRSDLAVDDAIQLTPGPRRPPASDARTGVESGAAVALAGIVTR